MGGAHLAAGRLRLSGAIVGSGRYRRPVRVTSTEAGLTILIPETRHERMRGLRRRRPTPMLFEGARSVHTFGMREPIVVAFLDRHHQVIRVVTVCPRRIVWCLRARHILEMPRETDVRDGDRVVPTSLVV